MYTMNSGLEQRICNNYLPNMIGNPTDLSANPSLNYSKLEVACNPTKPEHVVSSSNKIEKLEINTISDSVNSGVIYNKKMNYLQGKKRYARNQNGNVYNTNVNSVVNFNPNNFINMDAPACQFIGNAFEIQSLVEQAFQKTTGNYLPKDITIEIISKENMLRNGCTEGTIGFCMNRKGFGTSNIVVMEGSLDRVMLTLGHEIGHSLSLPLTDPREEEVKAFAFSLAWMKAIKENDIGNLAANIIPEPAKNGLHNVAFDFVIDLIQKGRNALDIFMDLMKRKLKLESNKGLLMEAQWQ